MSERGTSSLPNAYERAAQIVRDADRNRYIADLLAPETFRPHCDNELDAGMLAADRLRDLLNDGTVTISRGGLDRYRRTLVTVWVDGRDVSDTLVYEGLGLRYRPGAAAKLWRLQHWCPGIESLD